MTETRRCMGSAIAHWAEQTPDNIAIDDADGMVSYAELDRRVTEYARAFAGAGLSKGDRICWLGKNSGLYFTLFAAA
ncbi:MAG: AMP-binding protein, partial [Sphingomonadales bacterium]|nr:AMP-binding protein [Sphingomonadales bacterium]